MRSTLLFRDIEVFSREGESEFLTKAEKVFALKPTMKLGLPEGKKLAHIEAAPKPFKKEALKKRDESKVIAA